MSENVTVVTDLPVKPRFRRTKIAVGVTLTALAVAAAYKIKSALNSETEPELVNVETDRMVNSLNTLVEDILRWTAQS